MNRGAMLRVILGLGLGAAILAGAPGCDPKETDFFLTEQNTPLTGNLAGLVSSGTTPISGATVALTGPLSRTATTGISGMYLFSDLNLGVYNLTTTAAGYDCPPTSATLQEANQTTTSNVACTVQRGSVTGIVRLNGIGISGVDVTLFEDTLVVGRATTGAGGTYTFTDVRVGAFLRYSVLISPPSGAVCTPGRQNVTVQANQAATANFDCSTTSNDFTINLLEPPPGYRHIGPGSSETCLGFTTTPARSGGAWTTMWTGPGTVGATQRSGTLDANGKGVDRQPINQFGNYSATVTVTAGGVVKSNTATVNVQAAQGSCPP